MQARERRDHYTASKSPDNKLNPIRRSTAKSGVVRKPGARSSSRASIGWCSTSYHDLAPSPRLGEAFLDLASTPTLPFGPSPVHLRLLRSSSACQHGSSSPLRLVPRFRSRANSRTVRSSFRTSASAISCGAYLSEGVESQAGAHTNCLARRGDQRARHVNARRRERLQQEEQVIRFVQDDLQRAGGDHT